MKNLFATLASGSRLKPWQLALCVLFVGWVPSLVMAYVSFAILSRALEGRITSDAQSLVGSLSKYVENEFERTGETMDYYRTLPATADVLQASLPGAVTAATPAPVPPAPVPEPRKARGKTHESAPPAPSAPAAAPAPPAREWLSTIYYSHMRIDGVFLTDAAGHLVAAVPQFSTTLDGQDYASDRWLEGATHAPESTYLTRVYARPSDGRLVASIIVAIRASDNKLLGFLGADTLIERIGRRLTAIEITRRTEMSAQLIDQDGFVLFSRTLAPNQLGQKPSRPLPAELLAAARSQHSGRAEIGGSFFVFHAVDHTGWTAVLEQPSAIAHQPVLDMRSQTLLMVGWLVSGTAIVAYILSKLYRRQVNASLIVEREQIFSEKILANMPVGIALVDSAGERFHQANGRFVEILRSLGTLSKERPIKAAKFGDLAIATPEAIRRVLRFGTPFQAVEQRTAAGGDGRLLYLTINLLRLQDSKGMTLGVLCMVEDSTPEVGLRQELINANAAKDQFLAQLSHELRTPLSPVITMVAELEQIAAKDGPKPEAHSQEAANALEIIRRNVELEARLIDDLLDITRISTGKLQLNRSLVDVHRVIHLAVEITQQDINAKKLRLELRLEAAHHHTVADSARLQQVFWNLIKNSVKFTPAGRRVTIVTSNHTPERQPLNGEQATETRDPATNCGNHACPEPSAGDPGMESVISPPEKDDGQSSVAGGRRREMLRIEIIDEGIGIAPENVDRIFNAFDQGQRQIARRFGGLGLGLAISKAMIEAHRGHLSASSPGIDQGATFTVELTTARAEAPALADAKPASGAGAAEHCEKNAGPAPGKAPASGNGQALGGRVLVVDDHLDTCLGMKLLLTRRGYRVSVAHSVSEALDLCEKERFDLLVSDLGLPDRSGYELMKALRERGGPPGIALSGFGMEGDIEKSIAAGFSEHLIKPVDLPRLEAAMRRLLAKNGE